MNIKTKILIPSVVAVVIMLLLGTVSYFGMRTMQQALDDVAGKGMEHMLIISDSRAQVLQANVSAYRLFSTMANFDEARIKKETATILGHVDAAIQLLKKMQDRLDLEEDEKKALVSEAVNHSSA